MNKKQIELLVMYSCGFLSGSLIFTGCGTTADPTLKLTPELVSRIEKLETKQTEWESFWQNYAKAEAEQQTVDHNNQIMFEQQIKDRFKATDAYAGGISLGLGRLTTKVTALEKRVKVAGF